MYSAPLGADSGTSALPVHDLRGGGCEKTWNMTRRAVRSALLEDAAARASARTCHIAFT